MVFGIKKMFKIIFFSSFLFISSFVFAYEIQEIVEKIDKLFRSDSSHGEMTMTIETPHYQRTLELEAWTRKMDDTFIVIKAPKKDKGITTLRKKDEMWNYFPKIDKVIKVPPSMMMGSWMGSDFTNDDLVREASLLHDYDASFIDKKVPEGFIWISLKAKEQTVSLWGEIRLFVDLKTYIPHQQIYFDEHGKEIRILYLEDIRQMGGKLIPTTLTMVPLTKKDHKTIIKYVWVKFDQEVKADDIFNLRNLRKKR